MHVCKNVKMKNQSLEQQGWQEFKTGASNVGEDARNGRWLAIPLGYLAISIKIKNTHTVWPSNSTSGNLPYRGKKDQYVSVLVQRQSRQHCCCAQGLARAYLTCIHSRWLAHIYIFFPVFLSACSPYRLGSADYTPFPGTPKLFLNHCSMGNNSKSFTQLYIFW